MDSKRPHSIFLVRLTKNWLGVCHIIFVLYCIKEKQFGCLIMDFSKKVPEKLAKF